MWTRRLHEQLEFELAINNPLSELSKRAYIVANIFRSSLLAGPPSIITRCTQVQSAASEPACRACHATAVCCRV